jgi:L-lactate dehydrogenase complex protein LldG
MTISREKILEKLRNTRRPFPAASPRPDTYQPITSLNSMSPEDMLARFTEELELLDGEVFVVEGDEAARKQVLELLESHQTKRIAAWRFKYIPVAKLYTAIKQAGYTIDYPNIHIEDSKAREREIMRLETAEVGLTGVDAVAATTGALVVSTAPGKGRIPTMLPPVHIAVVELKQFMPRIEDWLAQERANGNPTLENSANICFIAGPSRTADIEKQLVLGVHGPKRLQVVVKR